jgi:hypothetical protein
MTVAHACPSRVNAINKNLLRSADRKYFLTTLPINASINQGVTSFKISPAATIVQIPSDNKR